MRRSLVCGTGLAIALATGVVVEASDLSPYRALLNTGICLECNLREANLRGADLSYTDLSRSDLRGAKFYRASPEPASLEGANLEATDLSLADLRMTNLRGANLAGANLSYANLFGSDLRGANLQAADLRGVNLDHALLFSFAEPAAPSVADFHDRQSVLARNDVLSLAIEANSQAPELAVQLDGALFDRHTQFPAGFDPLAAGMHSSP